MTKKKLLDDYIALQETIELRDKKSDVALHCIMKTEKLNHFKEHLVFEFPWGGGYCYSAEGVENNFKTHIEAVRELCILHRKDQEKMMRSKKLSESEKIKLVEIMYDTVNTLKKGIVLIDCMHAEIKDDMPKELLDRYNETSEEVCDILRK